jgi:hypothetical protein
MCGLILLLGLVVAVQGSEAQTAAKAAAAKQQQTVGGGMGMTWIDGKPYYLVNLAPELAFGKFGIGFDLNLRVGKEDGVVRVRKEDFDETYDYLRIIRYVRYGLKSDPIYVRLGSLDYSRLGHGFIMYYYRNAASYDDRKIGVEFDLDFEKFGFESMYSDIGHAGIFGLRGYVRPLKFTKLASIPVIGGFEVGATYAADFHPDANKTWGDVTGTAAAAKDGGSLSIVGFDLGLPLLSLSILKSTLYFDYAKIVDFGSGAAAGIDLNFSGMGLVTIGAKYERRWTGDQFAPVFFDALYERQRYTPMGTQFESKAQSLKRITKSEEGYYGEMVMSVMGTFNVLGAYYSPVGVKNQGVIHLELDAGNVIPILLLSGGYDKSNVGRVFRVDENSIFYLQVGYKPTSWLIVSTLYQWTFAPERNADNQVVGYKTQKRIEPKVGFVFNF